MKKRRSRQVTKGRENLAVVVAAAEEGEEDMAVEGEMKESLV